MHLQNRYTLFKNYNKKIDWLLVNSQSSLHCPRVLNFDVYCQYDSLSFHYHQFTVNGVFCFSLLVCRRIEFNFQLNKIHLCIYLKKKVLQQMSSKFFIGLSTCAIIPCRPTLCLEIQSSLPINILRVYIYWKSGLYF